MAALRSFKRIPGPLQLLLLLLLAVRGRMVVVTQLPETISATPGDNLTLTCTVTGLNLLGNVWWYKGLGRNQPLIYSDKPGASSQVVRVTPGSNTDYSIDILRIRPEDAGTYYCVKLRPLFPKREKASGKGTVVSVIAKPSPPVVHGPPGRITTGSQVSFNCSTEGFSPREIAVIWLKDGKEMQAARTNIMDSGGKQGVWYRVESMVEILLEQGDMNSQLTCQIQHRSLDGPLQKTFPLGDALRGLPQQSLLVLWIPLFLSKIIFICCLFLMKVWGSKNAKDHSRTFQEMKRSESPIRNSYS